MRDVKGWCTDQLSPRCEQRLVVPHRLQMPLQVNLVAPTSGVNGYPHRSRDLQGRPGIGLTRERKPSPLEEPSYSAPLVPDGIPIG